MAKEGEFMPTVAITGAGSGLGRALAIQYAKHGYKVYLMGRSADKLHLTQYEIYSNHGEAEIVLCDISENASISIAFQQIGQLDVFISNAGIGFFKPLEEYHLKDIECILNTNVKGTILSVQRALPLIKESNGRILTIISTAGLRGKVHESIYCASKYAVRGFTESLQEEWRDKPYSITPVYMGGMNTPFWNNSTHIVDLSRLKNPQTVAEQILHKDDGRKKIVID